MELSKDETVALIEQKVMLPMGRLPWLRTLEDIRSHPEIYPTRYSSDRNTDDESHDDL